jgi:hypothetical protein
MTKEEWDQSTNPMPMLRFLTQQAGTPTFRRFACECCRRVERWIPDEERWKVLMTADLGDTVPEEHPLVAESVETAANVATWCAYAQATDDKAGKLSFARAAAHAALIRGPYEVGHDPCSDFGRFKWDTERIDAEYAAQADILRRLAPRHLRFDS